MVGNHGTGNRTANQDCYRRQESFCFLGRTGFIISFATYSSGSSQEMAE